MLGYGVSLPFFKNFFLLYLKDSYEFLVLATFQIFPFKEAVCLRPLQNITIWFSNFHKFMTRMYLVDARGHGITRFCKNVIIFSTAFSTFFCRYFSTTWEKETRYFVLKRAGFLVIWIGFFLCSLRNYIFFPWKLMLTQKFPEFFQSFCFGRFLRFFLF